jgi:zinc/manganese transport system permease protein
MTQFFAVMLLPIIACLLLAGIHGYLGIHIVSRQVIFTDLAMAQIAALGAAVAMLFHFEFNSNPTYFFSLAFTMLGALVLASTHFRDSRIPQEAVIGVAYVVSAAAAILVLDKAPHGEEMVKDLLAGRILWISKPEILTELIVYSLAGIILAFASGRIHLLSQNRALAVKQGMKVFWWDLLFYCLFGIVVTISVRLAGVLLVFSFLVVPALIAFLFVDSFRGRIILAWVIGVVVAIISCVWSFYTDWPTGATVVVTFGLALLIAGAIHRFFGNKVADSA